MLATFGTIGWGVNATYDTLARMQALVRASYGLPVVRTTAVGIVQGTGVNTPKQADLIFNFLRRRIRFMRDPYELEALHVPELVLGMIAQKGRAEVDCDDVAMLGAALGMAIGLRARFVAVGPQNDFQHVFTELQSPAGGEWFNLDIQRPAAGLPATFTDALALEV